MKSKRSKACDISPKVKAKVWERDGERCIVCGSPNAAPNAHYISRAQSGLGIEQNIVTLCGECHRKYDQTTDRPIYHEFIKNYLKSCYSDWDEENLKYRR